MRPRLVEVGRLQRLAVFEAAARLGSFTAAAAEIGTTQPGVTRQIRLLETALDTELFHRTPNRIALTAAGERLRDAVQLGFDALETGLSALADERERARGNADGPSTFVLATHPGFAQQWLVPRLDDLQRVLPGFDLRLWLFDRSAEVESGSFDAAVMVAGGPSGPRIGTGPMSGHHNVGLFAERVVPVATPALAGELGLSRNSSADAVLDAPLLHMDSGGRPWMSWSEWLGSFDLSLPRTGNRVLYDNYPVVLQQALAGRGVALGWRTLVDDLINDGLLVEVGPQVTSDRAYVLVWPDDADRETIDRLRSWFDQALAK